MTSTDPRTRPAPTADTTPDPDQPIPYTLTAKAHAALDQDGTR